MTRDQQRVLLAIQFGGVTVERHDKQPHSSYLSYLSYHLAGREVSAIVHQLMGLKLVRHTWRGQSIAQLELVRRT